MANLCKRSIESDGARSQEFPKFPKVHFTLKTGSIFAIFGTVVIIVATVVGLPRIKELFAQSPVSTGTVTEQAQVSLIEQSTSTKVTETIVPTLALTKVITPTTRPVPTEITDVKGVEMVLVPEGVFTMGSDEGKADEKPAHQVYLDTYYIDKYEVTNALYKMCVIAGACELPTSKTRYNDSQYAQHPVVYVDWNMAKVYCEWRGAKLPTEAEWEKAARGTDGRSFPWSTSNLTCDKANFLGTCVGDTNNVGRYPNGISPYGAYDMIGNVWEWVADWYSETYYATYPSDQWLSNPTGPENGLYRVLRGGSWSSFDTGTYTFDRFMSKPTFADNNRGFRCARLP
jgi:formylglycine-generating enzyme required for sulfatase activity